MNKFWWQVAGFFLAALLTVTQLRPVLGVEWYGKSEWYMVQANPQSVGNYPCDSFSINAAGKLAPDVPKTEEEKKQFELANPPNPGLVTPNYLYRSGDVPDAPRLARAYGGKPEEWNEHRTPGFMENGRKVYLRWFRNRYSVVDYEYKFVAECGQAKEALNQKILHSIKEKGKFSTRNILNTNNGKKACLAAVNEVLRNAGIEPLDDLSVLEAKAVLDNGRGTPVDASDAEPGDIVLVDINGQHHIGFCLNNGCSQTISNSSSNGSFSFTGNGNFSYKGSPYNGSTPNIYRLNP